MLNSIQVELQLIRLLYSQSLQITSHMISQFGVNGTLLFTPYHMVSSATYDDFKSSRIRHRVRQTDSQTRWDPAHRVIQ